MNSNNDYVVVNGHTSHDLPEKGNINAIRPCSVGWLEYRLNDQEMDHLWKFVENQKEDYKDKLAGNISSSYSIVDEDGWFFNNTLLPMLDKYDEVFKNMANDFPTILVHPLYLHSFWVNFQKQGEFNPLHNHSGVYSFVIWMKIPTEFSEQKKIPFARSNGDTISNFSFEFINIIGQSEYHPYTMGADKEGMMLFFPAALRHQVYPFYNCDGTRISISGNIALYSEVKL